MDGDCGGSLQPRVLSSLRRFRTPLAVKTNGVSKASQRDTHRLSLSEKRKSIIDWRNASSTHSVPIYVSPECTAPSPAISAEADYHPQQVASPGLHVSQIYRSDVHTSQALAPNAVPSAVLREVEEPNTAERLNKEKRLDVPEFALMDVAVPGNVLTKSHFEFSSLLGKGGYSCVYAVKLKSALASEYALKIVSTDLHEQSSMRHMLEEEVRLLQLCRGCEHVVGLFGYQITPGSIAILLERATGDLATVLAARKLSSHKADIKHIKYWGGQIFEAVGEIHALNIVHADLKPANFLVVGGSLKLCDFGIASNFSKNTTSVHRNNAIGTLPYMAPETLSTLDGVFRVTRASDIWSCGIILFEMAFRYLPYSHDDLVKEIPDELFDGTSVPPRLQEVLKQCLAPNPKERSSATAVLSSAFFSPVGIDIASFTSFVEKVYVYGHAHGRQNRFEPQKLTKRSESTYHAFEGMQRNR